MPQWVEGLTPSELSDEWISAIAKLFLAETGEIYNPAAIRALPIPIWRGNLLLIDGDKPSDLAGLLWCMPYSETRARVVAFAIHEIHQSKGLGTQAWDIFCDTAREAGHCEIQLEVRKSNERAIAFYKERGLEIIGKIEGYYSNGVGYVMRGQL
ncbi:MAG: GNAT family N-acetyltransferase [Candidatus Poseidoniales archaeon]